MTTQAEFEAMILEAIVAEGTLTTLGAENGVEIDGHGPSEGNVRPIEGWFSPQNGTRTYFSATLTIALETFEPDYDDDDDYYEEDEGDDD